MYVKPLYNIHWPMNGLIVMLGPTSQSIGVNQGFFDLLFVCWQARRPHNWNVFGALHLIYFTCNMLAKLLKNQ